MGGPEAVAAVVARARDPGQESWHRRLLANHPTPARRLAVLERPELAAEATLLDGFTAALLATLTAPLVVFALVALLMGSGQSHLGQVGAALVAGPLLGGSVGLGLWRASLVRRVAGGAVRPAPVAFGVAAGLVLALAAVEQPSSVRETTNIGTPAIQVLPDHHHGAIRPGAAASSYSMMATSLPLACPSPRYRSASGTSGNR
jgi:hypothetical protein